MPTDATGTPTPLGIPTFNTSVDAPSGLGFNAAMPVIDTLIQARVNKPAGLNIGDVPVWNGSTFVIPTGTRTGSNFLRDDGSWQPVATPAGTVVPYAGSSAPTGWLFADGSAISRSTYAGLFAILSTIYGAGDGSTTFNLPDLRGRMVAGYGFGAAHADVNSLGANDGSGLTSRRPKHNHTASGSSSFTGTNANTGTESADHIHNVAGTTGGQSADHTHSQWPVVGGGTGATDGVSNQTLNSNANTGGTSNDHTHSFNVNSGGRSAAHTHNYTPAGSVSTTVSVGPHAGAEPNDAVAYIVLAHIIKF
jgi:microcystin-dependent protein